MKKNISGIMNNMRTTNKIIELCENGCSASADQRLQVLGRAVFEMEANAILYNIENINEVFCVAC